MSGSWQPVHDGHAIDAVAIFLFFSSDFPPRLFQRLTETASALMAPKGLTTARPVHAWELHDGGPVQREVGTQFISLEGLSEQRQALGHWQELVSVETNSIGYRCSNYPGWTSIHETIGGLLTELLPIIQDVMTPIRIRLEYLDRFLWFGDGRPELNGLLRSDSRYVAPHVIGSVGHCHSNSGAFLSSDRVGLDRVLQVDLQSALMSHFDTGETAFGLTITTAREDRYDPQDVELSNQAYNSIMETIDVMHRDLIHALAATITSEMADVINLGETDGAK